MDRDVFLAALSTACLDLQRHFRDSSGHWLVKLLGGQGDTSATTTQINVERVYELLCCFTILNLLQGRVSNLRLVRGAGRYGYRFPYSPGDKHNFAFFRFEFEGSTYDLCFGTGISTAGEADEHPDISLQIKTAPVGDGDRSPGQPVALWDGKHHTGCAGKPDVQQMNWWCDIFSLPRYSKGDILDRLMDEPFKVSAVVTNAESVHINRRLMLHRRFSVVVGFNGDLSTCSAVPSRAEHEGSAL